MQAPEVDVTLSSGEKVPLKSLYENGRMALVFLRHFGCVFCREHVGQLRRSPELNIVFVTLGTPEQTEEFRIKMNSPHKFISDPQKELHKHFNLLQGGLAEMLNPHVMVRAINAMFKGYMQGKPTHDPKQLPGVFLIEQDGRVTWQQRGKDVSDNPTPGEIRLRLVEE